MKHFFEEKGLSFTAYIPFAFISPATFCKLTCDQMYATSLFLQIIWFTALFPYFVMSVLLVRSVTLPGASIGLWKVNVLNCVVCWHKNHLPISIFIFPLLLFIFSTLLQTGVNLKAPKPGLIQQHRFSSPIQLELVHFRH